MDVVEYYPGLRPLPFLGDNLTLEGDLEFSATFNGDEIVDSYRVRVDIPREYPKVIPKAFELDSRIPLDFHQFEDGSLCLGSRLAIRLRVNERPTLLGFVEDVLIPYLYSYSIKERTNKLPYGELRHGNVGLFDDYMRILNAPSREACKRLLLLGSLQRRKANRHPCPCGSGLRVGKCHNRILNYLRRKVGRLWFREECKILGINRSIG